MRVLVVTTEPVPLPGSSTTGAGLRAWGLAEGLRGRGFDVEIAMAADALANVPADKRRTAEAFLFERDRLTEHVRERNPDVLAMQHWGLMDRLGRIECPLAMDLAGPHLLERAFWGSPSPERDLAQKLDALARADFLTCSGRFQRHYFMAFAMQCGFDPADPDLLPVIPFSVSPELPPERPHDASLFVYSGILLPWQDPSVAIEALLGTLGKKGAGRFAFIGGPHPSGDVSRGRFDDIIRRIETSKRATFESPMPFDALQERLAGCGVALDLMARNAERELAFTSRTVVYLSCGLPVIYNDYSELSQWIARFDAGWCLDPADGAGVRSLVERLLDSPEEAEKRRENARRLVRERLTWDRTIEPLARWCQNPKVRANKGEILPAGSDLDSLRRRLAELEERRRELSGRRLVRLSNFLRRMGLHRGR